MKTSGTILPTPEVSAELRLPDVSAEVRSETVTAEAAVTVPHVRATIIGMAITICAVAMTPKVSAEFIPDIFAGDLPANFITLDDHYIMTADGLIFFVKD